MAKKSRRSLKNKIQVSMKIKKTYQIKKKKMITMKKNLNHLNQKKRKNDLPTLKVFCLLLFVIQIVEKLLNNSRLSYQNAHNIKLW